MARIPECHVAKGVNDRVTDLNVLTSSHTSNGACSSGTKGASVRDSAVCAVPMRQSGLPKSDFDGLRNIFRKPKMENPDPANAGGSASGVDVYKQTTS